MTKTRATTLARRARAHGYYRTSRVEAYVFCPCCRERVQTEFVPWSKERDVVRALDKATTEHLQYDCERTES
jgi:hypothetical protein